ncbi:MAG: methionyl-tRNA formyltransferase [Gammaproteobacteria bacterium]|nr:methionyl-tRNA formyltransferase [Gammaproteobacteria bacterium]
MAFAGTPQFAVPALRALVDASFLVPLVLTQPDRPAGRGRKVTASPVKAFALEQDLAVRQPERLPRTPPADSSWGPRPDVLVVAAYGLLLPQWLLDWPRVAAVNIHASLLPRWRGASPIHYAILAGDAETGISIMRMAQALDAGPVYVQERLPIASTDTTGNLHDQLSELGAQLLLSTLPGIIDGTLEPVPQDEAEVTYAPKISKAQSRLDWRREAAVLERQVRAFNPWPVAEARLDDGRTLRIWGAESLEVSSTAPPGTVLATGPDGIDVVTGKGLLRIETLQPPGSRPMDASAYLNAHSLSGQRFVV